MALIDLTHRLHLTDLSRSLDIYHILLLLLLVASSPAGNDWCLVGIAAVGDSSGRVIRGRINRDVVLVCRSVPIT